MGQTLYAVNDLSPPLGAAEAMEGGDQLSPGLCAAAVFSQPSWGGAGRSLLLMCCHASILHHRVTNSHVCVGLFLSVQSKGYFV